MKYSTMMAIAFCGVLAVAVSGCKYDDDEAGAATGDAQVSEVSTEGNDEAANTGNDASGSDVATQADADAAARAAADQLANADSASLGDATGVPFDQDPNYTRCTDVDFAPVYFKFDASTLDQVELAKIEAVAQHLAAKPDRVVIVEGNCDERGSNEYNLSLGDIRAIAIREYLVKLGVQNADARIQTKSYGEEKPAVTGAGEGAWSKNRRGEFAVFQHK